MPPEFGFTGKAHLIVAFQAFVHDNGMPGVRLTNENGDQLDVIFSIPATQALQKQLALALQMATSSSRSQH